MNRPLRGALVGCGMISEYHLRGWVRIPGVQLVALCDPRVDAADGRRRAHAPDARVYADMAAMLAAERPDFVDVITPPELHAEHVRLAAAAGAHVICQKPLCPTADEARRLVAELRGRERLFLVHENHRYRPWFQEVRRHLAAGTFGRPCWLRLEQLDPYEPGEAFKSAGPHGVALEYGTHLVDMVRAALGEPDRVWARMHRPNGRVRAESLAHVTFEYPDATAVVDVAWKAGGLQQGAALLVGDRGEAWYEGRMTRGEGARLRLTAADTVVLDEPRRPTDEYVESFHLFQRAAAAAMSAPADHAPPQPAVDNLRTLLWTFACYTAAAEGRAVTRAEVEAQLG